MCLEGTALEEYPDVDPGVVGARLPQQPSGHDSSLNGQMLFPLNGNGHTQPQLPQIPHVRVSENGRGPRPQGPVGKLTVWFDG